MLLSVPQASSTFLVSEQFERDAFNGWTCDRITTCGGFGKICGGYKVKARGTEITKTFQVPAGVYTVKLDFIKIDTWFVRFSVRLIDRCAHCITKQTTES